MDKAAIESEGNPVNVILAALKTPELYRVAFTGTNGIKFNNLHYNEVTDENGDTTHNLHYDNYDVTSADSKIIAQHLYYEYTSYLFYKINDFIEKKVSIDDSKSDLLTNPD